jgi:hypothetical protein
VERKKKGQWKPTGLMHHKCKLWAWFPCILETMLLGVVGRAGGKVATTCKL